MIKPILIVNDEPSEKKERTVEIYKNEVFKDIELLTYKHVEGSGIQDAKTGNAISADNSEDMDGAVIARYVEFRDAQLRNRIQFALADHEDHYEDDDITLEKNKYTYYLVVDEDFKDKNLRVIAEYIHRFLVWGALHDWYLQFGMLQLAQTYGSLVDGLDDTIAGMLSGPSIVKRPLQPFGPAQKIY